MCWEKPYSILPTNHLTKGIAVRLGCRNPPSRPREEETQQTQLVVETKQKGISYTQRLTLIGNYGTSTTSQRTYPTVLYHLSELLQVWYKHHGTRVLVPLRYISYRYLRVPNKTGSPSEMEQMQQEGYTAQNWYGLILSS